MSIMCPTHLHINPACPQNYEVNLSLAGSNVHVSDTLTQTICTTTKWSNITHRFQFNVNTVSDTATHNYPQNYQMKLSLSDSKIHNVSNTLTQIVHYEVQLTTVHHHLQRSFLDHVIHWNKMDVFFICIFYVALSSHLFRQTGAERRKVLCFSYWKKVPCFSYWKKEKTHKTPPLYPVIFNQSNLTVLSDFLFIVVILISFVLLGFKQILCPQNCSKYLTTTNTIMIVTDQYRRQVSWSLPSVWGTPCQTGLPRSRCQGYSPEPFWLVRSSVSPDHFLDTPQHGVQMLVLKEHIFWCLCTNSTLIKKIFLKILKPEYFLTSCLKTQMFLLRYAQSVIVIQFSIIIFPSHRTHWVNRKLLLTV